MKNYTAAEKTALMKEYRRRKQAREPLADMAKSNGFISSSAMACYIGRWARAIGYETAVQFGESKKPFTIKPDMFELADAAKPHDPPSISILHMPWTKVALSSLQAGA